MLASEGEGGFLKADVESMWANVSCASGLSCKVHVPWDTREPFKPRTCDAGIHSERVEGARGSLPLLA